MQRSTSDGVYPSNATEHMEHNLMQTFTDIPYVDYGALNNGKTRVTQNAKKLQNANYGRNGVIMAINNHYFLRA